MEADRDEISLLNSGASKWYGDLALDSHVADSGSSPSLMIFFLTFLSLFGQCTCPIANFKK